MTSYLKKERNGWRFQSMNHLGSKMQVCDSAYSIEEAVEETAEAKSLSSK
jgi:hypothetical protein